MARSDEQGSLPRPLTAQEKRDIACLEGALHEFSPNLRLQAGTGGLNVIVLNPDTHDYYFLPGTSRINQNSIAAKIDVDADGGDPW